MADAGLKAAADAQDVGQQSIIPVTFELIAWPALPGGLMPSG
jgi:hypothetical protein